MDHAEMHSQSSFTHVNKVTFLPSSTPVSLSPGFRPCTGLLDSAWWGPLPVIVLGDNTSHSTIDETDREPSSILPKARERVLGNSKTTLPDARSKQ